jgi:hypothetical protein
MIDDNSFYQVSLGCVFGNFDGNMKGKLMEMVIGILFGIEKSKETFYEVLSLFGKITNIFGPETEFVR